MAEKKKSKPIITRIKLNPEQAVLACCQQTGRARVRSGQQCTTGGGGCGAVPGALQT